MLGQEIEDAYIESCYAEETLYHEAYFSEYDMWDLNWMMKPILGRK